MKLLGVLLLALLAACGPRYIYADLTNANLTDVFWSTTTCPDMTNSATNGSSPQSCCANMNGNVLLACSP